MNGMDQKLIIFVFLFICNLRVQGAPSSGSTLFTWNISATAGKGDRKTTVLNKIVGQARKGKLHAILGPSGSGKTTVLRVLSDTVPYKSLSLLGSIEYAKHSNIEQLYVAQEDLLFAQLSTFETLDTSVSLKSPLASKSELSELVDSTILSLGLKKVKNSKVGNAKTRGLSGGEKKRLAIGEQLIGSRLNSLFAGGNDKDVVIFADECTSGLDSFQALNVISLMREMADREGHTVVTTIHQPRASIWALFDDITLLSEGRVIFTGPRDTIVPYFTRKGYACPSSTTPAEFYLDLISIDYSSPRAEKDSRNRIETLANAFEKQYKAPAESVAAASGASRHAIVPRRRQGPMNSIRVALAQFKTLFLRSWRQVTRDKSLNIARFASSLFSALLFGAIYFKLGTGAGTVPDRLGLLQVAAINTAMTSIIKATTSFVQEKLIINRERRGGSYRVLPYFLAKLFAEAPLSAVFPCLAGAIIYKLCGLNPAPGRLGRFLAILTLESFASSSLGLLVGSFASSVDQAVSIAPSVMVIFIVFGGLYVVNAPKWLSWAPRTSLIRYAYEALCINELQGLELKPEAKFGPKSVTLGDQVLDSMGYGKSSVKQALVSQACIIAFNYLATYLSLLWQKPQFEKLQPYPKHVQDGLDIEEKVMPSFDSSSYPSSSAAKLFKLYK